MSDIRNYSTTAASNTDDFPENMAPSAVNDGARKVQSDLAKLIKDEGGTLTTGGTAAAYTLTLNTAPSALADGLAFAATASATSTGAATLTVTPAGGAAFTAKKIRKFSNGAEADIEAGDIIANGHYLFQYDSAANGGSGAYILLNPSQNVAGNVVQAARSGNAAYQAYVPTIPLDDTIPQITEGTQFASVSITPKKTGNRLRVRALANVTSSVAAATDNITIALFQGATANAIAARFIQVNTTYVSFATLFIEAEITAPSTAAITFSARVGCSTGSTYLNGGSASRFLGGAQESWIAVEEIAA